MTLNLNAVAADAGAPAPMARAATPQISAAGVNDASALARQQLPSAVPAPTLLAAYTASAPPPPKQPARTISTPSSPLAAQFIAQEAGASGEELAIFTPRTPVSASPRDTAEDDFISNLRAARGEAPPARVAPASMKQTPSAGEAPATQPATVAADKALSPRTTNTPQSQYVGFMPAVLTQFIRKPMIATVRGATAYQLAEARNATIKKPALAEAAL